MPLEFNSPIMTANTSTSRPSLDLITIGRSSVDLYGEQVGGRLEDMASFAKYIGGSPTNIAAGSARLGLKSAVITRVGNEHMGRFVREQLQREGVDVRGVVTDPERLTALVLLGIKNQDEFPLIFYRDNCADMALCEDDIDPAFIAEAGCVCATGTHLSNPQTEAAVLKALRLARQNGARTALDIDYRPNLWGLAGHEAGESRFIESARVSKKLQSVLSMFDLIVGTEEEFHIAGGSTDTLQALRTVREVSDATLVCKRGPMGAVAFAGPIAASLDDGESGPGFPIEVFNVLGAGDGFMSGLLRGWLRGESWPQSLKLANACGAFAVSRHGCTPAYPSWQELTYFFETGITNPALRHDKKLEHVHWATNRDNPQKSLKLFAFDHRSQLEDIADAAGADRGKISAFKDLCFSAAISVAGDDSGYGILCDGRHGQNALFAAAGTNLWVGRPVEWPGSCPLTFEPQVGVDCGGLAEWPLRQVVKALCFYHPSDSVALRAEQDAAILKIYTAARRHRLNFLLEIVASKNGEMTENTVSDVIQHMYQIGINPDFWKLEPLMTSQAWSSVTKVITDNDPYCAGIVVLGLDAPTDELVTAFNLASQQPMVLGFAVGRTIFADTARAWFAGNIEDEAAVAAMAANYAQLCASWDGAAQR
jgi:5-dehydro-2-deoxygluconokinase